MLPFLTGGCALDPCTRINDRMQSLGYDMMRYPDAMSAAGAGEEIQQLSVDAVRYGCFAR